MDENCIAFEIRGKDYDRVNRFIKKHSNCPHGTAGDQYVYEFIPTGLGMVSSVKCSCGKSISLGDFLDIDFDDDDEMSLIEKEDERRFERAVSLIRSLKDPRTFKMLTGMDQTFDGIMALTCNFVTRMIGEGYSVRLNQAILRKYNLTKIHGEKDNYKGLSEAQKIKRFYKYFEKNIKQAVADAKAHILIPIIAERIQICEKLSGTYAEELYRDILAGK